MRYILDTHAILWCTDRRNNKLSPKAEEAIIDQKNSIFISSASLWEIAIKKGLGKIDVSFDRLLDELDRVGFSVLHAESKYLQKVIDLPQIHKDPFDRLIIATALVEDMTLITSDDNIQKYDVRWVW